jgi:hypothetical protein
VHDRPLRYPPPKGREKGVDVQLAVDFVRLALDDEYDLAIVASADSDLVPALEFVRSRFAERVIEAIAWEPNLGCDAAAPIDVPGGGIVRRTLVQREFDKVSDRRNFLVSKSALPPGQSGRRRLPPASARCPPNSTMAPLASCSAPSSRGPVGRTTCRLTPGPR